MQEIIKRNVSTARLSITKKKTAAGRTPPQRKLKISQKKSYMINCLLQKGQEKNHRKTFIADSRATSLMITN